MKTYKNPGKARKKCPECSVYVHARALICICNYVFGKSKMTPSKPIVHTDGGRGKKLCKCGKYVGVRTLKCISCNNSDFNVKKEKEKESTEKTTCFVGNLVYTPSGPCPITYNDDVSIWCEELFLHGLKSGKTYTKEAIKYWCPDKSKVKLIDEWCKSQGYEKGFSNTGKSPALSEGKNEALLILN